MLPKLAVLLLVFAHQYEELDEEKDVAAEHDQVYKAFDIFKEDVSMVNKWAFVSRSSFGFRVSNDDSHIKEEKECNGRYDRDLDHFRPILEQCLDCSGWIWQDSISLVPLSEQDYGDHTKQVVGDVSSEPVPAPLILAIFVPNHAPNEHNQPYRINEGQAYHDC